MVEARQPLGQCAMQRIICAFLLTSEKALLSRALKMHCFYLLVLVFNILCEV